jgi:hypothetical protein
MFRKMAYKVAVLVVLAYVIFDVAVGGLPEFDGVL